MDIAPRTNSLTFQTVARNEELRSAALNSLTFQIRLRPPQVRARERSSADFRSSAAS